MEQMVSILHTEIRIITHGGEIVESYGKLRDGHDPLKIDFGFYKKAIESTNLTVPKIFCENEHIFYGIIELENKEKIVIGPVTSLPQNFNLSRYMVEKHNLIDGENYKLPYCEMKLFGRGLLIIYHYFTGKEVFLNELLEKNGIDEEIISSTDEEITNVIFTHQELEIPHNPYELEIMEMNSIENGDIEMLKKSLQQTYYGEVGKLSKNQVRQAKNIAICVIVLASRAAIRGGLIPEQAFSMVDGCILKIEEMSNEMKIEAFMRQVEFQFAQAVRDIKQPKAKNYLVNKAKNYIFQNLHKNIVVGEIGLNIGVNSDYLSTLFRKEEGITIQKYIRQQKISLAEKLLRHSKYSLDEISSYLSFSSQSHFGKCFKESTGLTPNNYRKKYCTYNIYDK